MLSEDLTKMSKKTHSQDLSFEEIWEEMDSIEPLTPIITESKPNLIKDLFSA